MALTKRSWGLVLMDTLFALLIRPFFGSERRLFWFANAMISTTKFSPPWKLRLTHSATQMPDTTASCPCFIVKPKQPAATSITTYFYLHGGAYVIPTGPLHWEIAARLASSEFGGEQVILVEYPLAPSSKATATVDAVLRAYSAAYSDMKSRNPLAKMVVLGDSAGGGLALALCQRLTSLPASASAAASAPRPPAAMVLFSPWTDATCSLRAEMEPYSQTDCMLALDGLVAAGKAYLNEPEGGPAQTGFTDANPFFGNMENLPPTTIFSGTREALHPENLALRDKLERAGTRVRFIVGEDCGHIWPLLQFVGVSEAQKAMNSLKHALEEDLKSEQFAAATDHL